MIHMLLPVCGMMNFVMIIDLRRPKSFLVVGENGQARKKQRLLAVFGKGIRVTPTMCHPKKVPAYEWLKWTLLFKRISRYKRSQTFYHF